MAWADIWALVPPPVRSHTGTLTISNILIDAAGEKWAAIFHAPKSGDIRKVILRTATVTTGDTVDVRIETVDATTGDPSGTLWGTNTNAALVIANSDDNVFKTATLTADATVAQGDVIAVVVVNGAGGGNMNFAGAADDTAANFPYRDAYTTSWTKSVNASQVSLEYSDGSYAYIEGLFPAMAISSTTFNTGSAADEIGNRWTPAFDCKVRGAWAWLTPDNDCQLVLYGTDGTTVLASCTIDGNIRQGTASAVSFYLWDDATDVELAAGSTYRLVLKPTTASSVSNNEITLVSAAAMGQLGLGTTYYKTSRADAGAWTDDSASRVLMGLIVSQVSDGAAAGGGSAKVLRMTGVM